MRPWLQTWRLRLRVTDAGHLDKAPAGILKNALGARILDAVCPFANRDGVDPPCRACVQQLDCVYPKVLKPATLRRGDVTPPPGYVLRYIGEAMLAEGDEAFMDVTCVGTAQARLPEMAAWVDETWRAGVGRRTARVKAKVVERIPLPPTAAPRGDAVAVAFEAPLIIRTRVGGRRQVLRTLDGPAFARALRQRIRALGDRYGAAPWAAPDGDDLVFEDASTRWVSERQYSARQGKVLRAEGVVGSAVLRGDLKAWGCGLALASRVGVGRMTSWGNGRIRVLGQTPGRPNTPSTIAPA